jgi:hypothetical protein
VTWNRTHWSVPAHAGNLAAWDTGRNDWLSFRVDGIAGRIAGDGAAAGAGGTAEARLLTGLVLPFWAGGGEPAHTDSEAVPRYRHTVSRNAR